jgi:hypothetical protein
LLVRHGREFTRGVGYWSGRVESISGTKRSSIKCWKFKMSFEAQKLVKEKTRPFLKWISRRLGRCHTSFNSSNLSPCTIGELVCQSFPMGTRNNFVSLASKALVSTSTKTASTSLSGEPCLPISRLSGEPHPTAITIMRPIRLGPMRQSCDQRFMITPKNKTLIFATGIYSIHICSTVCLAESNIGHRGRLHAESHPTAFPSVVVPRNAVVIVDRLASYG